MTKKKTVAKDKIPTRKEILEFCEAFYKVYEEEYHEENNPEDPPWASCFGDPKEMSYFVAGMRFALADIKDSSAVFDKLKETIETQIDPCNWCLRPASAAIKKIGPNTCTVTDKHKHTYQVVCTVCSAAGPVCSTEAIAIERWNTGG